MQSSDISDILAKINEMRAVFVVGQRAVPFLEEVFVFLREISPLLDEINSSIRDSAAKMPRATSQLQSVSEATELATTEILDLVDAVLDQIAPLRSRLERSSCGLDELANLDVDAEEIVTKAFEGGGIPLPPGLERVWNARRRRLNDLRKDCTDEQHVLSDIRQRINRIMISLQVQDITAQQLASVNHLIESMRARMTALVDRLGSGPLSPAESSWPVDDTSTFDPNARYDGDGARQEMIDDVFLDGTHNKEPLPTEPGTAVTDALIDQLFTACDAEPPRPAETRKHTITQNEGPASQEEIDALFKNGRSS